VLAWLAVLGFGLGFGGQVFGRLDTGSGLRGDAESVLVSDVLARAAGSGAVITGLVDGREAADPAFRAELDAAVRDLRSTPGVRRVVDPWSSRDTTDNSMIARDGRAVVLQVELEGDLDGAARDRAVERVGERLRAIDAQRVLVGGEALADQEFQDQAQEDLERGEALALPFMLLLLLLVFRGVSAAVTPLAVAAVAVAGALLVLLAVSELTAVSVYSVNVVTMLGLGLAVDYSLLVVSRSGRSGPPASTRRRRSSGPCRPPAAR
jgi:RND superfamily putative drug exporter